MIKRSMLWKGAWIILALLLVVLGLVGTEVRDLRSPAHAAVSAARQLGIPAAESAYFDGPTTVTAGEFDDDSALFPIASVSKPFTAVAVMQLVEKGRLELEDTIADVFSDVPLYQYENGVGSVTVKQLLAHTSGFTTTHGLIYGSSDLTSSNYEILGRLDLHASPGTAYAYSNLNYRVLGLMIEEVTAQPLAEYMVTEVFAPRGLARTYAGRNEAAVLVPGHTHVFAMPVEVDWLAEEDEIASGSIVSTREDLVAFLKRLVAQPDDGSADVAGSEAPPLPRGMIDLMWTPEIRISDSESWGLGWEVNKIDSTRVVSHGGDLPGYQATIMVAPHRRAGFVFLANANTLPLAFAGEFALQPIQRWVATGQAPDAIRIPAVRLFTLGVLLLITFLIVRDVISIARTKDRVSNIRSAQRPAVALGVSLLGAAILPAIVAYIVTIGVFADALVMFPDALALLAVGTVIALIKGVVLIIRFAREAA